MDNLPTESETVTIPAALLGGGDMVGKVGQPVTVTLRGTLVSADNGIAKIELQSQPENEAEDMTERDRVRGMGQQADMEDY